MFGFFSRKPHQDRFFIKEGYRINRSNAKVRHSKIDPMRYQRDVYIYAAEAIKSMGANRVADVGCGTGDKLVHYVAPVTNQFVGVNQESTISVCKKTHQVGEWYAEDLEKPRLHLQPFDLITSADVIEHLRNPDHLIEWMRRHAHCETEVILSTPDRDLRRGPESMGPPENRAHVREWNRSEFADYLRDRGLKILNHQIVDLCEGMKTCQLVHGSFSSGN